VRTTSTRAARRSRRGLDTGLDTGLETDVFRRKRLEFDLPRLARVLLSSRVGHRGRGTG
jgi:hypothetical protein